MLAIIDTEYQAIYRLIAKQNRGGVSGVGEESFKGWIGSVRHGKFGYGMWFG